MNSKHSRKYTKEFLETAVKECKTFAQVVRLIVPKWSGGVQALVTRRIKEYGLDVSHFTGMRTNSGSNHKGGPKKLEWTEVLVMRKPDQMREQSWRLRRAMIESGILHKCSKCGSDPVWNSLPLCLHVDHQDGNYLNCTRENVRFLCPNCHSQTPQCRQGNGLIGLADTRLYAKTRNGAGKGNRTHTPFRA